MFNFSVMKVAKKLKDEGKTVFFAVSNKNDFSYELSEYGMDSVSGDKPVIAAKDAKEQKFVMKDEFRCLQFSSLHPVFWITNIIVPNILNRSGSLTSSVFMHLKRLTL